MFKDIMKIIAAVLIAVVLFCTHLGTGYVGYKAGSWFGYVKGVTHKFLPWRREDNIDKDGRRRILPRPFNPGDTGIGEVLDITEEEAQILESVLDSEVLEVLEGDEND
jgi:hypothetical protein